MVTTVIGFPYSCEINIAFPTIRHAEQAMKVMEVDKEIGKRATKSFCLIPPDDDARTEAKAILRVRFEATEAKFLRVSVSSFYDYLTVALKCFQEFGSLE